MASFDRFPARTYEYIDSPSTGDSLRIVAAGRAVGLLDRRPTGVPDIAELASADDLCTAQLRAGVEELLKPENRGKLVAILAYHVVTSHALAKKHR